ncbi:MAG: alpha/beta fold hydrolase [Pseudomonadota bacterium]
MGVHRYSVPSPTLVELEVDARGVGDDAVLLLPSLGRGRGDFDGLVEALTREGFRTLALDPRGIGHSDKATFEHLTLHSLADDAVAALDALAIERAHVIGHAFGNRVARCVQADHPDRVRSLILLAAGGKVPPVEEAVDAFRRFVSTPLAPDAFLSEVAQANFSPAGDPSAWADGWWLETARGQATAAGRASLEDWWLPRGEVQVLIVQGLDDRMAPPENGRSLRDSLGARARLVEVERAGHALLPEQPAKVEAAVLAFLHGQRPS